MKWWRWAAAALAGVAVCFACGSGQEHGGSSDAGTPPPPVTDGGSGSGGGGDAGRPDAGYDGGGADGGSDGGTPWIPPPPINFPSPKSWDFYGPQNGGPHDVLQVAADQGGNIWVAGGEDGLFFLPFDGKKYADKFQRFTMADGLRPYGYLPDGSDPVGPKYLKVLAVEGGAPGTAYVGYEGLPGCSSAWDNPANRPGPNGPGLAYIYKSGDADRVTVDSSGKLRVVHYDIFSGPNVVKAEMDGREKICSVERILYDAKGGNLWFGGNHGFAWG